MEMGAKEDWEKGEEAVGVNRKEYYRSFVNRQLFSTIQNISFFIKEVNVRNKKSVRQREVILNNFDVSERIELHLFDEWLGGFDKWPCKCHVTRKTYKRDPNWRKQMSALALSMTNEQGIILVFVPQILPAPPLFFSPPITILLLSQPQKPPLLSAIPPPLSPFRRTHCLNCLPWSPYF